MKERGKAVEMYNGDLFSEYGYSSDPQCKKHPQSSSVGVCAYCLEDRLMKLVCSNCGEQRGSCCCSCSSDVSSNRNSNAVEVGSVGRMSFLIENEKKDQPNSKPQIGTDNKANEVFLLKRSNSSSVEVKRKRRFWRIGRLFGKKREKNCERSSIGGGGRIDEKSDLWVVDYMGVSRSRSLCSFRGGGGFLGSEDGGGDMMSFSGARSSISAARRSGLSEGEPRKSGFSEVEPRRSGYDIDGERRDSTFMEQESSGLNGATRRIFSLKEGNFTSVDGSGFIDLKFDFPSEGVPDSGFGGMREDIIGGEGDFMRGGSCRITVSDRGIKKSRKSFKSWSWIFQATSKYKEER